jgi:Ras-related protein Rab-11A
LVHFSKKNQYFGTINYAHTFKIEDFLNYDSNGNTELNKYLKYRKSNHCNLLIKPPYQKTKSVYIKKSRKSRNLIDDVEVSNNSLSNTVKIIKGKDTPSSNINYDFLFKISLIGDSNVGKTSIILRFIDDYFKEDTQSTIGIDFKVVSLELEPDIYGKMQIWDTCGSERFKSLTTSFIKSCTAFVLVFDLTRKNSFENIEQWINIINENTTPKYMILIGNKSDLVAQREVSKDTVLNFCRVRKFNYIEVSAKNNDNVEKMFKEVAYQLYNDIKKDKGKKAITSSSEFTNIQVKNENEQKKGGCCS